jgi:hypothetical protein
VTTESTAGDRDTEITALRARVAELETQLEQHQRDTAQLVARSQDKLYWLERWHVDLDRVMAKPGAVPALEALRASRGVVWSFRRFVRRLRGRR